MDDLDTEDAVHVALAKALENIFDSKGVSRWLVCSWCLPRKCGTRDRHYKHMRVHLRFNLQGIQKTSRIFFLKTRMTLCLWVSLNIKLGVTKCVD